jgi:hypothetical protein
MEITIHGFLRGRDSTVLDHENEVALEKFRCPVEQRANDYS